MSKERKRSKTKKRSKVKRVKRTDKELKKDLIKQHLSLGTEIVSAEYVMTRTTSKTKIEMLSERRKRLKLRQEKVLERLKKVEDRMEKKAPTKPKVFRVEKYGTEFGLNLKDKPVTDLKIYNLTPRGENEFTFLSPSYAKVKRKRRWSKPFPDGIGDEIHIWEIRTWDIESRDEVTFVAIYEKHYTDSPTGYTSRSYEEFSDFRKAKSWLRRESGIKARDMAMDEVDFIKDTEGTLLRATGTSLDDLEFKRRKAI